MTLAKLKLTVPLFVLCAIIEQRGSRRRHYAHRVGAIVDLEATSALVVPGDLEIGIAGGCGHVARKSWRWRNILRAAPVHTIILGVTREDIALMIGLRWGDHPRSARSTEA